MNIKLMNKIYKSMKSSTQYWIPPKTNKNSYKTGLMLNNTLWRN